MIRVEGMAMKQGAFALAELSFEVPASQYAVLMGPTGCGKTSVIEAICGLRPLTAGTITIDSQRIDTLDPADRAIGYVPQDGALFTTMRVAEQIALPLHVRGIRGSKARGRVDEIARLLAISHLLPRRPQGLSGGERQRIALARALVFHPRVLCLDEPFSALDEDTRLEMYNVIDTVRARTRVTALHVTHSRTEAQRLGDLVMRLEDGVLTRDTPDSKPATARTQQESPWASPSNT